jgi:hypothetical protein
VIQELLDAPETESWDETRARVGRGLGLPGPVPGPVLRRMLAEPAFARDVAISRSAPGFLRALFDDPRTARYADPPAEAAGPAERSNAELLRSAAGALMRWGRTGFARVDEATFERRWSACQGCPNLGDPPEDRALYRVKLAGDVDRRVCGACGCVASRKARLPTETCPVADPADPAMNRWGEPVRGGALATA